jgi:methionyl-tRNA formyltransferase
MKIIYAGTPEISISCLDQIAKSDHEISLVLTMPDKPFGRGKKIQEGPIKKFAKSKNLSIFQPANLKDKETQSFINQLAPDLVVVFAYGMLLPEEVLSIPKFGCLNIHTSLLPAYRGAAPIQRSIINGEKETGISFMKMAKELDTGPIYESKKIAIDEVETSETLSLKMIKASSSKILKVIDNIENNNFNLTIQKNSEASYAKKLSKEEALINWDQNAEIIKNKINGFCPNPCAFTFKGSERLTLFKAKFSDRPASIPGQVIECTKSKLVISAADYAVEIIELSREGKKRMSFEDFKNGSQDFFNEEIILS